MDPLVVQRCLAGLEERFIVLYESAEARFDALLAECNVQEKEKVAAQQQLADLKQVLALQNKEKEESQQQLFEMKQQLEIKAKQLQEKSEELDQSRIDFELILLQLKQVQEELENYFLLSRHQDELLSSYSDLQKRIAVLLS